MATAAFEDIAETFDFLDDWEDRYRHVIELGKAMPPLDDSFRAPAYKVDGCARQVWLGWGGGLRLQPPCPMEAAMAMQGDSFKAGPEMAMDDCCNDAETFQLTGKMCNKGEARNALARAVFFNRLGEIRDRSFEQQRYRASGLNLVTAAVVLWNTVYLERATNALRGHGQTVDDALLQYLSPLGWEHINLTGDYFWRSSAKIGAGKFRPLRPLQPA